MSLETMLHSLQRLTLVLSVAIAAWPSSALAYRPFDSTDPAVADLGEFEVELSPVSFRHERSSQTWIAPQVRLNYGFAEDWEVVIEGQEEHVPSAKSALIGNALSVKTILREGSLQEKSGLSLATELGVLLPGLNAESGVGASWAGIAGERWSWGAIHVNFAASLSRDKRGEMFVGAIVEGPTAWKLRPVAELV
jgi:hypothetical protein